MLDSEIYTQLCFSLETSLISTVHQNYRNESYECFRKKLYIYKLTTISYSECLPEKKLLTAIPFIYIFYPVHYNACLTLINVSARISKGIGFIAIAILYYIGYTLYAIVQTIYVYLLFIYRSIYLSLYIYSYH